MLLRKILKCDLKNSHSLTVQVVRKQVTTAADLSKAPTALSLKWLTDKSVWVEKWPLTSEKFQALEQLVQEQLSAQHTEESTSPWNSPNLSLKRNLENGDIRAINKVIQAMGSLQLRILLPSQLSKRWPIIVIDLKDCFFTIPLQEQDRGKNCLLGAFFYNSQPIKIYQYKILPH